MVRALLTSHQTLFQRLGALSVKPFGPAIARKENAWPRWLAAFLFCLLITSFAETAGAQTADWLAQVREQVGRRDLSAALGIAERRLADAPRDLEARAWRARLLNWSGKREEAEREFRALLDAAPNDTDILQGLADVLMAAQRWDEAMALVARAENLLPRSAEVQVRRGRALRAMGRAEEARKAFRQALALEPKNEDARDGLDSVAEGPRHELRMGLDVDKFNYTDHARAVTLSVRSELASRWTSNLSGVFHHRAGQDASRFSAALTRRLSHGDALTAGFAAARDQGVIPKAEAFFEYGHGMSFGNKNFVRGMELTYGQRWLWFDAPRIVTLSPGVLLYLPRDWMWQVTLAIARSRFPGLPAEWRPSGSTRLTFPLHRRLYGNIFYALGTENFALADQLGRFSARTFGGGLHIMLRQRQELTSYVAYQDRSQGRTQTSFGFSYAVRF
ncbi:MAG TPA: tetratricopeptide repeat protein [Candidatus Acidoferrales bacterium]|nr:tetratricopeptide repeat protein [Candidatus Acidoferrales bacterium]